LSLVFLVHPINSEAVLYISATQEVLYFVFGILAVLILAETRTNTYYYLSIPCLLLSLLSKETGALFMVVSLFYLKLFRKNHLYLLTGVFVLLSAFYITVACGWFFNKTGNRTH
jgi:hypothetical protein